jgi:hypothetical protein
LQLLLLKVLVVAAGGALAELGVPGAAGGAAGGCAPESGAAPAVLFALLLVKASGFCTYSRTAQHVKYNECTLMMRLEASNYSAMLAGNLLPQATSIHTQQALATQLHLKHTAPAVMPPPGAWPLLPCTLPQPHLFQRPQQPHVCVLGLLLQPRNAPVQRQAVRQLALNMARLSGTLPAAHCLLRAAAGIQQPGTSNQC